MTTRNLPFLTLASLLALAAVAAASDITLKNDSIPESGQATVAVQGGLVPGEIAVAVLSTAAGDYPITLKNIKVFVAKQAQTAPNTMTVQLYVWSGGAPTAGATTPSPAQAIYTSPQLSFQAGGWNLWDVTASNIVLNGTCLVGCKVVSTGAVGNPPFFGTYQPNNVTDTNGCQAGKNFIWAKDLFTNQFSWANLCSFGASGDWGIHVDASTSAQTGSFLDLGGSLAGGFAPVIETELEKLEDCDLMIWQFPLWWFGMPAILKGWADRVLAMGRTYGNGRIYEKGVFRGKRALLSLTTGGPAEAYTPEGFNGDIMGILRPVHRGVLQFLGFDVLAPQIVYGPVRVDEARRREWLEAWAGRLRRIGDEAPIQVGRY